MSKKVVLVTGGTGGIGTAICQRLAHDFTVIACYFKAGNHQHALNWQQHQQQLGFDCQLIYADIRQPQDCEDMVLSIVERFSRIDVLVNNAGMTADASLKNMNTQQWLDVIDTNLNSVFNLTKQVLPVMLNQAYGRIISISSINGRKGQFGQCNYAASKSALYGFSKSLAQEVAKKGITVNTISPGYIQTPMLESMKPEILEAIVKDIPVGRLGKPEEIASMVEFLAREESGFITGANFDINGGQYYG
jgi:acetoacetyl-CoA reductase